MNYKEALKEFEKLFENRMSDKEAKEFLENLHQRGENFEEIAAASEVMRKYSLKLEIENELKEKLIDVVGTGGDRLDTFNISTAVSLLLPACGCYVAKHGNRSITSKSGSADLLEALGVNISMDNDKKIELLKKTGFTFLFAKEHHPIMKNIMSVRKEISHPTIFNIIGPLTNPAGVKKYLLGVNRKELIIKIIKALEILGARRAMVVNAANGMDEISITCASEVAFLNNGQIREWSLYPDDYGFNWYALDELQGGSAEENAKTLINIFDCNEYGAKRDAVILNAAAALYVDEKVNSIEDGVEMAREAIDSKKAKKKLEEIIETSRS